MAQQRQYEPATLFNVRCVDMRHLWDESREFQGKPQDKPSWFSAFITPKTVAQWHLEPALAGAAQALQKLYANNPGIIDWPIADGDLPNKQGKQSDWARGHWVIGASTSSRPNIELVQAGGACVKLAGRGVAVKPGDYCMVGVQAAVKQTDARAAKFFLNTVVFTAPGQEIAFSSAPTGAEMMAAAQAQGMQVQGFGSPSTGGFGGMQQQPSPFGHQSVGGQGPGTFAPPPNTQGPVGGFAPQPGAGATASPFNAPPNFAPNKPFG